MSTTSHEPPQELALYRGNSPYSSNKVLLLEPMESEHGGHRPEANSLDDLWQMLRHRKWTIAACAMAGGLLGGILTLEQSPKYRAQAELEIQTPVDSVLGFQSGTAAPGENAGDAYLPTQVKILKSRTLRNRVFSRLVATNQLSTYVAPTPWENFRTAFGHPVRKPSTRPRPGVPEYNFVVNADPTHIVEIVCESPDPKFAADYLNTLADEYIQLQIESRWEASKRTTTWLSKQLEDMRQKLQDSEAKLQAYDRSVGMIGDADGLDTTAQEKLKEVQAELSHASADRIEKQSIYEIATSSPSDSIPQVIDNTRLSGYQTKLSELRRELAELTALYTPEHYKVARVEAQITEMQTTFQKERDSIIARIRNDYLSARRREELLTASYTAQGNVVSDRASKMNLSNVLKREVDTDRQLYGALLQKIKESSVASAMAASNINVVDPAITPSVPFQPRLSTNLAEGLASGLIFGLFLAVIIDRVNRSLKSPGEASLHLKIPELGVIPVCDPVLLRRGSKGVKAPPALGRNGSQHGLDDETVELVTWQDSPSLAAESFRSVITSILLSNAKGRPPKTIVVTSVDRQDGKSTTVSNLGLALAEIGQKVLLIDADMRKPRLHQIFDAPNTWGLSDLLREKTPLKDSPLEVMARKTGIANLYLLPSGPATLSISNLLYSERMMELLERLCAEFDTILIDTPPLLYISDARVLGRLAEAAILVIRAGQTTRDAALSAKQRLVDDGIAVLGTVLNRWDPRSKSRYGSSYYYHRNPKDV